jgi:hypothetical protein
MCGRGSTQPVSQRAEHPTRVNRGARDKLVFHVRVAVGKDANDVGASTDLAVRPFVGCKLADLTPDLFGRGGEGQHVGTGTSRYSATRSSLSAVARCSPDVDRAGDTRQDDFRPHGTGVLRVLGSHHRGVTGAAKIQEHARIRQSAWCGVLPEMRSCRPRRRGRSSSTDCHTKIAMCLHGHAWGLHLRLRVKCQPFPHELV